MARRPAHSTKSAQERFGFGERWGYYCGADGTQHGLSREAVARLYGDADALINLCGSQPGLLLEPQLKWGPPLRILVDTDPGYQQISN